MNNSPFSILSPSNARFAVSNNSEPVTNTRLHVCRGVCVRLKGGAPTAQANSTIKPAGFDPAPFGRNFTQTPN